MANAGRVAIVPKGEYSSTVAYKRLDLVRYNNDLYVAKKANTGVAPTDSETWMLSLENVSQTQYDDIISGTQLVGKAKDSLLLNGYTASEVGASGARNLIPYPYYETTLTRNGITFTDNGDGSVTLNGTSTANSYFTLLSRANGMLLRAGTYTICGATEEAKWETYNLRVYSGETLVAWTLGNSKTFTLTEDTYVWYQIGVYVGTTVSNLTFHPMLELGPVAHDYVPYHFGGAEDALKLNGLTAEEFVSNDNLLINADFRNPVNSSGKTEWSGTGLVLGVDMWNFEANAASGWTMSLTDSGIQVTFDSDGFATFAGFQQRTAMESGEKYTLSFSVDNKIYTKIITGMVDLSGGIRISGSPVYLFYLSSNNTIYIRVYKSLCTDYTATVNWIKLEKGSVATPLIPPNKEVEKLKCGIVDNAKTANGVTLYKSFTEIDSTFTQDTPITDVVAKMARDSKLCVTIYGSTSGIYPASHGVLELDKHSVNGNYTAVKFTDRINGKIHTAVVQSDIFIGWVYSADGGNANLLSGVALSGLVQNIVGSGVNNTADPNTTTLSRIRTVHANCPTQNSEYIIDTTFTDSNDNNFERRQTAYGASGNNVVYNRAKAFGGAWTRWEKVANASEVLPIDGSVPMSGRLYVGSGYGIVAADELSALLMTLNTADDRTTGRQLILGNSKSKTIDKCLYLFDRVNNVNTEYTVLHTGNSQKVLSGTSAPTDTTALWYDTTNKILKRYVDGAWQA